MAILTQATNAICADLVAEREPARIAVDADIDSLTLSPVGGWHLMFADRDPGPATATSFHKFVAMVIAGVSIVDC